MKICWDNLEELRYNKKTGKWYKGKGPTTYIYKESCKNCGEPFLAQPHTKGKYCSNRCHCLDDSSSKECSKECSKILSIIALERYKNPENHPSWKGGYASNNIPMYDTYAPQIEWCEEVRRNKEDPNILEVRCTYCGKWYISTPQNICDRVRCINGYNKGQWEGRLYCSNQCKQECPIHGQVKYTKGFKINTSREVQPELRQLVLKRDEYECQKCGSTKSLHCHHITGVEINPIESADIDNCITFCKECHNKIHKQKECNMRRKKC